MLVIVPPQFDRTNAPHLSMQAVADPEGGWMGSSPLRRQLTSRREQGRGRKKRRKREEGRKKKGEEGRRGERKMKEGEEKTRKNMRKKIVSF
jgi:hypothetical protein